MDAEPGRGVLLVTHRREEVALAGRERELAAGSGARQHPGRLAGVAARA